MSRFLLIHGAWYGGWCWEPLQRELDSLGHVSLAPDLPGHGADATPPENIAFPTYTNSLISLLQRDEEKYIVVGHSFGAMLAQSIAEICADRISHLVFLAGNVAPSGRSLLDIVVKDPESLLGPQARTSDGLTSKVRPEVAIPALFNECSPETAQWAASKLCPEPMGPWSHKIDYGSPDYRGIKKTYIVCEQDRAVTPFQQRSLLNGIECNYSVSLDADHSPFLSRTKELAKLLCNLEGPI